MSSEALASVAHDVVSISRNTAQKAIEAQCNNAKKLIDNQGVFTSKVKENLKLKSGSPMSQLIDNLDHIGADIRSQTKTLLDNCGRLGNEVVDWASARSDSGIDRIDEMFLSRNGPALDRVFLPGLELVRSIAQQTESLTEKVTEYVIDKAEQVVIAEAHEAKQSQAPRKTAKTAH